jgi:Domain of unknown function (DUF3472)/Domain of unknown function (DUF5077)
MHTWPSLILALSLAGPTCGFAELRVPAFTAYADPEPESAQFSVEHGVTGWDDPRTRLLWFGEFSNTGAVSCSLCVRLPADAQSRLKLTIAGIAREVLVHGAATNPVSVRVGAFDIPAPGYQRITLESLNSPGQSPGEPQALVLDGPATRDAHFNLRPRRNAASVHLVYPTAGLTNLSAFYCEVTALDDPIWTFYMACGWHRGYLGMQVNSATERRIIFSVWDSGGEPAEREKVRAEDRVQLVAKGEGVFSGDFGNEGTGGHSHLVFPWRTGEVQRFLVRAQPDGPTHTLFAGYYYRPDQQRWMLISSWRAPREGGGLRGLHSFSEDFGDANGHLRRKALYGNQWAATADGRWVELTAATFSHDATGREDRRDRFMGVEAGRFFLSHGGYGPGWSRFGERVERPGGGPAPAGLPPPPAVNR